MARFASCPQLCVRHGITRRHEVGAMEIARRAIAVMQVMVLGLSGIALRRLTDRVLRRRSTPAYIAQVHRRLIEACGIRLEVTGVRRSFADPGEPVLVVGNHVGWLDVMALGSVQPVTMVSKKEVGQWPLVGWVARAADTIFIDRHRPRAVEETRKEVGRRMRSGEVVATFPEATTTCGRGLAPMFPAMFQTAIDVGVPVQPVAFAWLDRSGALTTAGGYVGEQSLADSILTILGQRDLVLRVEIRPRLMPKHVRPIDDRRALRTAAASSIALALDESVGDWEAHRRPATCRAARLVIAAPADPLADLKLLPRVVEAKKAGAT